MPRPAGTLVPARRSSIEMSHFWRMEGTDAPRIRHASIGFPLSSAVRNHFPGQPCSSPRQHAHSKLASAKTCRHSKTRSSVENHMSPCLQWGLNSTAWADHRMRPPRSTNNLSSCFDPCSIAVHQADMCRPCAECRLRTPCLLAALLRRHRG